MNLRCLQEISECRTHRRPITVSQPVEWTSALQHCLLPMRELQLYQTVSYKCLPIPAACVTLQMDTLHESSSSKPETAAHAAGNVTGRQLSWPTGAVVSKTRTSPLLSVSRFSNDRLAIGFGFQRSEGTIEWRLDGSTSLRKVVVRGGASNDLVVLPAGCEFYGAVSGLGDCLWLYYDRSEVERDRAIERIAQSPVVDSNWNSDRLSSTLANQIRLECSSGFQHGSLYMQTAAAMLITQFSSVCYAKSQSTKNIGALAKDKLRTIIDYIECNVTQNLSLSDLAELVQLNPIHFCRAFKAATGRPPHQFQIERRIERAKTYLLRLDLTLADVALMAGFSSQAHFSSHFRRLVGITPARYRSDSRPPAGKADHMKDH